MRVTGPRARDSKIVFWAPLKTEAWKRVVHEGWFATDSARQGFFVAVQHSKSEFPADALKEAGVEGQLYPEDSRGRQGSRTD